MIKADARTGAVYKYTLLVSVVIFLTLVFASEIQAEAAETVEVTILGMTENEKLHLYQLTDEKDWTAVMKEWLTAPKGYEEYKKFADSPDILDKLSEENQQKFIRAVITAMKEGAVSGELKLKDAAWTENGEHIFLWDSSNKSYHASIPKGSYIVIPESRERVYVPQLCLMNNEETTQIIFTESEPQMRSAPKLVQSLYTVEEEEEKTFLAEEAVAVAGDRFWVEVDVWQKPYPEVYGQKKMIRTIGCLIGAGLTLEKESITVKIGEDGQTAEEGTAYTTFLYDDVTVYCCENQAVFFESNNKFYFMNGASTGNNEPEEVLSAYAQLYGTMLTMEALEAAEHCTVLCVISMEWEDNLCVEYQVTTDHEYSESDRIPLEAQFHYTTSPLQADRMGVQSDRRELQSYYLEIQLLDGGMAGDPEGTQEPSPLTGGVFAIYRKLGEVTFKEGSSQEQMNADINEFLSYQTDIAGKGYQAIQSSDGTKAEIYIEMDSISTNDAGIAGIGSLDPTNDYLVVQTIHPADYANMRYAYRVFSESWSDGENEDSYRQTIEWTNYTGVYLPESGGMGTTPYMTAGLLIMLTAIGLCLYLENTKRKKKEN